MKERSHLIANHLAKGYSVFVFSFLRNYVSKISRETNILDVGCGRSRNLRLFHYFHFPNLMGIDRVASNDHDFHDFKLVEIQDGLPFNSQFADVVLCNFVLMFVQPDRLEFVVKELLRVSSRYLILELNRPNFYVRQSTYMFAYDFKDILNIILTDGNFTILKKTDGKISQRLLIERKR